MAVINAARPDKQKMEDYFRRFWSLKEAYTKARGDGIAFDLGKCGFSLAPAEGAVERAQVAVDGQRLPLWGFYVQPAEHSHWISTSRGPPSDAVDAHGVFRATFEQASMPAGEMRQHLAREEPRFTPKSVADLVAAATPMGEVAASTQLPST